jgi:hypothetical protein
MNARAAFLFCGAPPMLRITHKQIYNPEQAADVQLETLSQKIFSGTMVPKIKS